MVIIEYQLNSSNCTSLFSIHLLLTINFSFDFCLEFTPHHSPGNPNLIFMMTNIEIFLKSKHIMTVFVLAVHFGVCYRLLTDVSVTPTTIHIEVDYYLITLILYQDFVHIHTNVALF